MERLNKTHMGRMDALAGDRGDKERTQKVEERGGTGRDCSLKKESIGEPSFEASPEA